MWWIPDQRRETETTRELWLSELRGLQAVADVAEYLCLSTEATSCLYPNVVLAWGGYIATAQFGVDVVADLRVLDAIITADVEDVDVSDLDWRP